MNIEVIRRLQNGIHHALVQNRTEYMYGPLRINGLTDRHRSEAPDRIRPQTQNSQDFLHESYRPSSLGPM